MGEPLLEFNRQPPDAAGRALYLEGHGGDTSNAAIAAARSGATVGYVTAVGEDAAEREIDIEALRPAFDNFQMRITRESLSQIGEVGDANWQQFIPSVQELEIVDGVIDSLDEDGDSPVPNITHRYPDRALFLVSPVCASYCRFCTRKRATM